MSSTGLSVVAIFGRRLDETTLPHGPRDHPPVDRLFLPFLHEKFGLEEHVKILFVSHHRPENVLDPVYVDTQEDPGTTLLDIGGFQVQITCLARAMNFLDEKALASLFKRDAVQMVVFDRCVAHFVATECIDCLLSTLAKRLSEPAVILIPDVFHGKVQDLVISSLDGEAEPSFPVGGPHTLTIVGMRMPDMVLEIDLLTLTCLQLYVFVWFFLEQRIRPIAFLCNAKFLPYDDTLVMDHGVMNGSTITLVCRLGLLGFDKWQKWVCHGRPSGMWDISMDLDEIYPLENAERCEDFLKKGFLLFRRRRPLLK